MSPLAIGSSHSIAACELHFVSACDVVTHWPLTIRPCCGRGVNGLHIVLLLFAYKLRYPEQCASPAPPTSAGPRTGHLETALLTIMLQHVRSNARSCTHRCSVYLIRGNHESAPVTLLYGFYAECVVKASEQTWQRVCNVRHTPPHIAMARNLCRS